MPKVPRTRRHGRGWEDELKAAMERDRISEEDRKVAAAMRNAAAGDAKRRSVVGKGFFDSLKKLLSSFKGKDLGKHWGTEKNKTSDKGFQKIGNDWFEHSLLGALPVSESKVRSNTPRFGGVLTGEQRMKQIKRLEKQLFTPGNTEEKKQKLREKIERIARLRYAEAQSARESRYDTDPEDDETGGRVRRRRISRKSY